MAQITVDYRESVVHLPDGATLVFHGVSWEEYERFVSTLVDHPHLRTSYDQGRLEIMSPLPEHEAYARLFDRIVCSWGERLGIAVEAFGGTTWKRQRLARGVEPDSCYYVANAPRIIGRFDVDLEVDPPPDIVVEVDITNESLSKFSIYAALGVPEIWRYDEKKVTFYERVGATYCETAASQFLAGLTPTMIASTLERSKTEGQTAALAALRGHGNP
jgi:Uma2 family endonuclease